MRGLKTVLLLAPALVAALSIGVPVSRDSEATTKEVESISDVFDVAKEPISVVALPEIETADSADESEELDYNLVTKTNIEDEWAKLERMKDQLREMRFQIKSQKFVVKELSRMRFEAKHGNCSGIKCFARKVAFKIIHKIRSHRHHKRPHHGHRGHKVNCTHELANGNDGHHRTSSPPFNLDRVLDGTKFDKDPSRRPHRTVLKKVAHVAKVVVFAVLAGFFVTALHRRCCCSSSRRAERTARREERKRRRAYRRAARKLAFRTWASKWCPYIKAPSARDEMECEEKQAMLAEESLLDVESAVGSEISQLRNAASVVDDLVTAEEGRVSMETNLPDYQSDRGDELPSYADTESEDSMTIADGFRPNEYTPVSSNASSVGRDAKQ